MKTKTILVAALAYILVGASAAPVLAQQTQSPQDQPAAVQGKPAATEAKPAGGKSEEELRKEAQNPIASLISVPIQENWNFNIGPADRTQNAH